MTADKTYPKHLRRMVDFCCDRGGLGCGHHIDGHGYGSNCQVPGCDCRCWHDHTICDHRQVDATDPLVEVERLRAVEAEVGAALVAASESASWDRASQLTDTYQYGREDTLEWVAALLRGDAR
jgi:hypothetical protein